MLLGINIGGTTSSVAVGRTNGELVGWKSMPTDTKVPPLVFLDLLLRYLPEILPAGEVVERIGVACGSPLDPHKGRILSPPNLPTWIDVPIVAFLTERFGVSAYLENDANAGALAEWWWGAGRGTSHMIFITYGTGCGAGLILNGKLYRGVSCYAGEIGHVRLAEDGPVGYHKAGSVEGFCSGPGIEQIATTMRTSFHGSTKVPLGASAREIGEEAIRGDRFSQEVLAASGEAFGRAIAILLDLLNPECIVVGSIFRRVEPFLRPMMEKSIEREALSYTRGDCRIVPSELGERIGEYAALAVARGAAVS